MGRSQVESADITTIGEQELDTHQPRQVVNKTLSTYLFTVETI